MTYAKSREQDELERPTYITVDDEPPEKIAYELTLPPVQPKEERPF